jgi:phospholipid transport system substrate-binding protein
MRWFVAWLLVSLSVAWPVAPLNAKVPVSAEGRIRTTVDQAFGILRDPKLQQDRQQRVHKIQQVVDTLFDWKAMARSCAGVHWRDMTEEQRQQFVDVFKELLAAQYMDDFDRFTGDERVLIKEVEKRGPLRVVRTILVTHSHEQVPIDYTLAQGSGAWWVQDLRLEGVSMVRHYRRTFSRFLVNHSVDELLKRLETKLAATRG